MDLVLGRVSFFLSVLDADESLAKTGSGDELAVALLGVELAVFPDHRTARDGDQSYALEGEPLEDVEVTCVVVRLGTDCATGFSVPNHDVCVTARSDDTLARIEVEDACCVCAGGCDELHGIEDAGYDTVVPYDGHAVLQAVDTVGNLGEVVLSHLLLLGGEPVNENKDER